MLLTESLNQLKQQFEREMRGEPVVLEPGYAEFYENWKKEKAESLPKLSAEERAQLLSDDLQEETTRRMNQMIDKKWLSSEKKNTLKTQAKQGELFLVSLDEGKHFDQLMSLEDLQKNDPLKVRLFSSTLISTTNNFEKAKEEQNLLHIAKNLRANHCLVERGFVENHVVHVDVVHTRLELSEVEVNLDSPNGQYDYVFKDKNGKEKHVAETQLPEEFGLAEAEFSPDLSTPLSAGFVVEKSQSDLENQIKAKKIGTVSSFIANSALQADALKNSRLEAALLMEHNQQENAQNEENRGVNKGALIDAQSRFATHVLESKKQVAARIAAQKAAAQNQMVKYLAGVEKYKTAQVMAKREEQSKKLEKKKTMAQAQKNRKLAASVLGLATGGLTTGFGTLAWWVTNLKNF